VWRCELCGEDRRFGGMTAWSETKVEIA